MQGQRVTVGRYELRAELGAGGFATVYRAYDPVLDREVALKVLHPHLARDAAFRERFVREGQALARIRHPNVVHINDAGQADGTAYLAMDLIEGASLDAVGAARGPLPLADAVALTEQIAGALEAVHARRLVHRDIKPANILIDADDGRAILLDLGIARALDSTLATSTGMTLGTPAFMAPEQIDADGHVTPQTDVYQLGATVYALLAGRPPFRGATAQVIYQVAHQPPADLAAARPDLPPAAVAAVMQALAKDPARRPAGPRAFATQLRAAAGAGPAAALPPSMAPPPPTNVMAKGDGSPPTDAATERVAATPSRPAPATRSSGVSALAFIGIGVAGVTLAVVVGAIALAAGVDRRARRPHGRHTTDHPRGVANPTVVVTTVAAPSATAQTPPPATAPHPTADPCAIPGADRDAHARPHAHGHGAADPNADGPPTPAPAADVAALLRATMEGAATRGRGRRARAVGLARWRAGRTEGHLPGLGNGALPAGVHLFG
ncbi:MAG: serine/threonine-protein kinase [Dehalococcoidia bacterium]